MTLSDLIFEAAIMGGMADPRDGNLAPEESSYGFSKLFALQDMLAIDKLSIYEESRIGPFNVSAGQGDVTGGGSGVPAPILIGPKVAAPNWIATRPQWIDRAGVIYTQNNNPQNQPELKLSVITTKEWSEIEVKGTQSSLSRRLFYDRTYGPAGTVTADAGSIYLYPVPNAAFQVVLYVPNPMATFPYDANGNPVFTTVLSLPPGYRAMLVANLAVKMCLGVCPVPPDVRQEAVDTLAWVRASNVVTHMDALSCDPATRDSDGMYSKTFNWIDGGFW